MSAKFHTALAPYRDARGIWRATYQLLNARGYAVASVSLADGRISSMMSGDTSECIGSFLTAAKVEFRRVVDAAGPGTTWAEERRQDEAVSLEEVAQ